MRKLFIFILFFITCIGISNAGNNIFPLNIQPVDIAPHREMRAVWLTTIGGLDWPHSYAQSEKSIEKQKSEFCYTLDQLQRTGINTVLLQTRIRATTIFPSTMEPWDGCLSGMPGKSPEYDALAFAIEECHRRGIQLHAWIVTIPVGKWNGTGCKNLRRTVPKLLKKIGDEGFMNPENPATASYLSEFCRDVAKHYDIDGIHLDYIRYPETWGKIANHDRGRQNITNIVSAIHDAVKSVKPWIMMSCSPIGKYADLPRQWSHGWNARDIVCQDAAMWMQTGLMDAIFPMMYFRDNNFYPFAIDWHERSNGRIVAPGLGIYFLSPKEKDWPLIDITRELNVLRQYGMGHTYFRSKFLTDNTKGLFDFTETYCKYPALVPAMTWYGFKRPTPPAAISLTENANTASSLLVWDKGTDHSDGDYLTYNVYSSDRYPVDVAVARNIIAVGIRALELKVPKGQCYAVTAVDRYGNESDAAQMQEKDVPKYSLARLSNKQDHSLWTKNNECPMIECDNTLSYRALNNNFAIDAKKTKIIIETMQGKIVCTKPIRATMDISNIPDGMYVVRITDKKNKSHRLCFMKKKSTAS